MRYRQALRVPEFRVLFLAFTVAILGSVVSAVALTVLVYERTGSPFLSSLTFALGFLPYLLSGLFVSAAVDRLPPRRLLSGCDAVSALLLASMAWTRMPTGALLGILALVSSITSVSAGARSGLVRGVVGDAAFVPARSLLRISAQSAQFAGNALGGLLLIVLSPHGLILVNSAALGVSALVTRFGLRYRPAAAGAGGEPLLRDSLRGAGAVLGNPELRRLLVFAWLLPLLSVAPEALAAAYVLGRGESRALVGWWLAALPVGVICGDLVGVWLLTARRQQLLIAPIAAVGFVPYLAFAATPPPAVALPLLVVSGLGSAYFLGLDGLVRDRSPEALFPRVMAINTAGLMTTQGVGFAVAGALAQVLRPADVIAAAGAAGLLVVLALRPPIRR